MDNKEAKELLDKYFAGECTPEEKILVERAYNLQDQEYTQLVSGEKYEKMKAEVWDKLELGSSVVTKSYRLWPRIAVAAAAVAAIVVGVWFYSSKYQDTSIKTGSIASVNDIAPGKNGAKITLANGKVIALSDAKSGVVIGTGDLKYSDGTDVSSSPDRSVGTPDESRLKSGDVIQMTASTARGQTYQFTLPDGTKVRLNADSKISFPSQFYGKARKILLDGEAYFEVEKDKAHPFIVESAGQEVEVLGTHFNINAYKDESNTKTTLLEGSVAISSLQGGTNSQSVVLKPNQQAILLTTSRGDGATREGRIKVTNVDTELAVAWKNNQFLFEDEELGNIMRMIGRWYNVEVEFTDDISREKFGGGVSRFDKVSKVLKSLEDTGKAHFKIRDRKIYVGR